MRATKVWCAAVALGGIAATGADAAEYVFVPGFEHTLKLRNPATDQTGSAPTTRYLSDSDGKGAGYSANVVTDGTTAFFFSSAIAAGRGNFAESITELDVVFSNVGGAGVRGLTSTIFPATFGLYVAPFEPAASGCTGATLPTCPGVTSGLPNFRTLRDGGTRGAPFNEGQAGSYFLFDVLLDGVSQRSIGGAIVMQDGGGFLGLGETEVLASSFINGEEGDISLLAGVLPGFTLLTAADDPYSLIYGWDESDFSVLFDEAIIGSGTVTYRITTGAWGDSRRIIPGFELDPFIEERSIVSFACFADPVGRGSTRGAIIPVPVCDDFGGFDGTAPRSYRLFGGQIGSDGFFRLRSVIPEPDTWAMLIVGFGLVGLSMRRGTRAAPATAA